MRRVDAFGEEGGFAAGDFSSDRLLVSFYDHVPDFEVRIPEFEAAAKMRLQALHTMERLSSGDRPVGKDLDDDKRATAQRELQQLQLFLPYPTMDDEVQSFEVTKDYMMRMDHLGHYILLFAFCKTKEAKDWFIKQEARLFALRLNYLKTRARDGFYRDTGNAHAKYEGNIKEFQECTPGARIFGGAQGGPQYETHFYELPFTDINPFWIAKRRVVLRDGMAYVPDSMITSLVIDKFKDRLREDLNTAYQGLDIVMADKRIAPFIKVMQEHGQNLFIAKSASSSGPSEKLTLANFEQNFKRSFPPCMRWVTQVQRDQKRRLKHQGKLQLRPFLKECGFTLSDSITWWRREMTRDPEIDDAKFDKNHLYDIEHAYGKKGHMKGQNSFGCASIIGFPLASGGATHGCPFKDMSKPDLGGALAHWGISQPTDIEDIVKKADGKHYQLACKEYFCKTHPGHSGEGSKYYEGDSGGGGKSAKERPSIIKNPEASADAMDLS